MQGQTLEANVLLVARSALYERENILRLGLSPRRIWPSTSSTLSARAVAEPACLVVAVVYIDDVQQPGISFARILVYSCKHNNAVSVCYWVIHAFRADRWRRLVRANKMPRARSTSRSAAAATTSAADAIGKRQPHLYQAEQCFRSTSCANAFQL